jgi:pimeloyl-ACP methyl ester carboxylesterase
MKRKIFLSISAVILAILIVGPFLVPVPELTDTVPPTELAEADSLFIDVNGLTVHYKTAGSGELAVILLHGFGASVFSWREVIPDLSENYTVIAYDRPAFGLTERPLSWEGENPYSSEAQVQLVIDLMEALGLEEAVLIGNSAGGKIAAETALAYPDRVQGLVLVDAAVYAGGGSPPLIRPLLGTPQLRHIGPLIARRIQASDAFLESAWHDPSLITDEIIAGYRYPLQSQNWDKALWELTVASRASDLEDRLSEIGHPVLVVTGDDDRIVPTEQSIRLASELPNAELSVFEACGHLPQEECPQAFLDAVLPFLAGLE